VCTSLITKGCNLLSEGIDLKIPTGAYSGSRSQYIVSRALVHEALAEKHQGVLGLQVASDVVELFYAEYCLAMPRGTERIPDSRSESTAPETCVLTFYEEISTVTKKDVHVVPHKDGWATKTEGASRAGGVYDTQREAIGRARGQAIRERVEVVIHGQNGRIRDSDSYGRDPMPPRDKKN
jgi:hypothetical protein